MQEDYTEVCADCDSCTMLNARTWFTTKGINVQLLTMAKQIQWLVYSTAQRLTWLGIECLCLCSLWSLLCVLWSSCSLWSLTTFTLCNTADEFDIVTELVVPQLCYKQLLWIQSQKCTIARVLRALGTSLSSPSYVVFLQIHSDLFWPNLRCVAQGIGFCANRWQLNVNTYNVWSGDMCTISLLQKWRLSAWLQSVSSAATCQLSCDMSTQLSAQMLLVSSAALC